MAQKKRIRKLLDSAWDNGRIDDNSFRKRLKISEDAEDRYINNILDKYGERGLKGKYSRSVYMGLSAG